MSKRYEDEIRDILRGFDDFPGERERQARRRRPASPFASWRLRWPSHLNGHRIMGGALLLMLFGWILRGPWVAGFPLLSVAAGYISLLSIILFVVALIMLISGGGLGGSFAPQPTRWRGQVIELPRRGGRLPSLGQSIRRLWRRLTRMTGRRPDARGSRGRDPFRW